MKYLIRMHYNSQQTEVKVSIKKIVATNSPEATEEKNIETSHITGEIIRKNLQIY